jgi:heavy metal sensor kinase
MRVSIRQRLTAWYALALLFGLAAFGFTMWFSLRQRLIAGVDSRLAQRLEGLKGALGADAEIHDRAHLDRELSEFVSDIPDGSIVQLWDVAGRVLLPEGAAQLLREPAGRRGPYTEQIEGHPWRVRTVRLESAGSEFEAQLAMPLDEVLAVMSDFRQLLLLLVPAVLTTSCLGGLWLSSRALRPVDAITSVARSISVHNLSQRIAVPRTGDELERMAQTWNDVLERLDNSVQRMRQFTSDASHELRTPLALVRATAELALRRDREPEGYRESLRQIEQEAGHMTELTESLLTLARADSDRLGLTIEPTDLNECVQAAVQQNAARAAENCVRLRAETSDGAASAAADPAGVRRILLILVDNALKHTPAGGTVTVSVVEGVPNLTLAVEDTGEGIQPLALPHIFERFYRADDARGGGGFGLGLSIAQAIAQAHGTAISAASKPGEGARFWLPLRRYI